MYLINRCKPFRALATRYGNRAVNRAAWVIVMTMLWLFAYRPWSYGTCSQRLYVSDTQGERHRQ